MRVRGPADWDAASYSRTATPQRDWSGEVLDRLQLEGDENVLDAGCGSGEVTAALLDLLPRGRVIALDGSPSMLAEARRRLAGPAREGRVTFIRRDLAALGPGETPEPVDHVFSNAVLHWVPDHPALFRRFAAVIRPGGRIVAQYGGRGNVAEPVAAIRELVAGGDFHPWLDRYRIPWSFNGPEETRHWLEQAGFEEPRCWLEERVARPEDPRAFFEASFLAGIRELLPARLFPDFVDRAMAAMGNPQSFKYVRLNIDARRA